jgi:hypothetical protein
MELTPAQKQVFDALSATEYRTSVAIAKRAGLRTANSIDVTTRYCRQLVEIGQAVRGGLGVAPTWRRA